MPNVYRFMLISALFSYAVGGTAATCEESSRAVFLWQMQQSWIDLVLPLSVDIGFLLQRGVADTTRATKAGDDDASRGEDALVDALTVHVAKFLGSMDMHQCLQLILSCTYGWRQRRSLRASEICEEPMTDASDDIRTAVDAIPTTTAMGADAPPAHAMTETHNQIVANIEEQLDDGGDDHTLFARACTSGTRQSDSPATFSAFVRLKRCTSGLCATFAGTAEGTKDAHAACNVC